MSEARIGYVVDNKYELVHELGRGGMSIVWLSRDKRLGKLWAVKEIKPGATGAQGRANRKAIIDEANFMKHLDHPAIPRVVDIIDEGPTIYVVMDLVNGRSLSKTMHQQGSPFDQVDVIDWGIQLCDVIGYLHGLNPQIVYRDLKPGNVMLCENGTVKLIDFGISYELKPNGEKPGLIGSPGYSAPEQINSAIQEKTPLTTRADIYALGATLYSLVTGIVPRKVRAENGSEHYDFNIRPIREINPQLSDGLEQIILRATAQSPDDRYQTIDEMRYDLEHYEELTQEYRAVQQRKLNTFWGRVRATVIVAVLGLACVITSALLKNSSYDSVMSEARAAGVAPADAQDAYVRAIAIDPARIEPYEELVESYVDEDQIFTTEESASWMSDVWQKYYTNIEDDPRYARLCYDVGILYLCYFDYWGTEELSGQGAIKNASQSTAWFERALEAYDPDANPEVTGLSANDYKTLEVYHTIGDFYELFKNASRRGDSQDENYVNFWNALEESIVGVDGNNALTDDSEFIVRLRLYQVAFESIASPTYLSGFRNAGITEDQANELLDTIYQKTLSMESDKNSNPDASQVMYDEIVDGYERAVENITASYHNTATERITITEAEPTKGE